MSKKIDEYKRESTFHMNNLGHLVLDYQSTQVVRLRFYEVTDVHALGGYKDILTIKPSKVNQWLETGVLVPIKEVEK